MEIVRAFWRGTRLASSLGMRVLAIAMLPGLLALASAPERAAADPLATFEALGPSPSVAQEVSADGSVVVGSSGSVGYRWTAEGGAAPIDGGPLGASADGSVVVGELDSPGHAEAFRWTATTGTVGLGFLPGDVDSVAFDTSADGSQVVGYSIQDQASGWRATAFRWTETGGMVALGAAPGGAESLPRGVSADGSVVVGELRGASGSRAFRWTADLGFVDLGVLPCAEGSIANDVSADGSVVVGTSGGRAFRWSAARGMQELPFGSARSVSADGTVVVGALGGGSGAIVWTPSGARLLTDLLRDYGVNLGGWTLQWATGVSDDGLVIVGHGHEPSLGFQGFRVTLAVAECGNGLDDDGDGLTDFPADPGCADENGLTERLVAVGPGTTRVIIDDFESGNFSLSDVGAVGESIAQGALPVLGGSRESAVSIRDGIPGASATIAVGGGFGTWSLTTSGFVGAAFRFWYDRQADGVFGNAAGPYVDLTSGGADRFLLEVATVTGLVHLDIQIFDSHGFNTRVGFTPPDGGACEIHFSSFVGVDFTSVRNVVLGHRPLLFTDANTNISFASFATAGPPPSVVRVGVEIKPGGERSPINLWSKGVIPVAILGSESFDPSQVDVTTLAFGPAGAAPVHKSGGHLVDVDADGFIDLLSHYRTQETGIAFGDSEACVSGERFDAIAFEGCAAVHARPIER